MYGAQHLLLMCPRALFFKCIKVLSGILAVSTHSRQTFGLTSALDGEAAHAQLGLLVDCDGDRVAAVDETGRLLSPHELIPLITLAILYKTASKLVEVFLR